MAAGVEVPHTSLKDMAGPLAGILLTSGFLILPYPRRFLDGGTFMSEANIIATCWQALQVQDLATCKPFGLDAATWIAALTAFSGVLLFVARAILKRGQRQRAIGHYVGRSLTRSRFRNLCRAVKPLMDENYRIFSRFGPNGGVGDGLPKVIRHELGVWYELRETIVENNDKIRMLLTHNLDAIPADFRPSFMQWLDHIDAFRAHVRARGADYRDHQFPKEVSAIVTRYA